MRVLVTGSSGFIGSQICSQLEAGGHEVIRVDLMLDQVHHGAPAPEGTHVLDVRDALAWGQLLRGVDAVCHQAALVGLGVRVEDMVGYASHNDVGTAALMVAMHQHDVRRLVFASSMVVYGEGTYRCPEHGIQAPAPRPIADLDAGQFENPCPVCGGPLAWELVDESTPLNPRNAYAASKVAQEHYASSWVRQAGASAIGLRYHNVYGPGMPRDTPYCGVAAMFRSSLQRGESPQVYEDGGQMRDFVYVSDVARANVAALESVVTRADYAAYNVCSGSPISIGDVAQAVSLGAGGSLRPQVTGAYRVGDVRHVVASPQRAKAELGFVAEVGPEVGLAQFATAPMRD